MKAYLIEIIELALISQKKDIYIKKAFSKGFLPKEHFIHNNTPIFSYTKLSKKFT